MTFAGEVLHVLKKDLRQARWMLAGYVALAAVGAFAVVGDVTSNAADATSAIVMGLLLAVGSILVAGVVQEDSPLRETAFWASRPLHRGTVATAKLGFALLVLLTAVSAQLLALLWLRISAAELLALSLAPGLLLGFVLIAAAFLAGGTRSPGQFGVTSLSLLLALLIIQLSRHVMWHKPTIQGLLLVIVLLGVVLVIQYRRRAVRLATIAGVAILVLAAFTRRPREASPFPTTIPALPAYATDTGTAATSALLRAPRDGGASPRLLTYVLSLPSYVPDTLLVRRAALVAVQANGREDTISSAAPRRLAGAFSRDSESLFFMVYAPELQLLRSASSFKTVLDLEDLQSREVARAAVKEGEHSAGVYPVHIRVISTAGRWVKLRVQSAGLDAAEAMGRREDYGHGRESIEFSLLDPASGRESRLEPVEGRSVSRATLLPAANLILESLVMRQLKSSDFTPAQLQRSRLVVRQWYPAQRYRTTIPVTLVQ